MDNITNTTDIPEERNYAEYFSKFYFKFRALNFTRRKKLLNVFRQNAEQQQTKEEREVALIIESPFIEEHIELTIAEIREKYGITKKPTEKDFYRICEGEKITVINSLPNAKSKPLRKYGCYMVAEKDRFFIGFNEQEKGKQRLQTQFQMLGLHFLYRDEIPNVKDAFESKVSEFQRSIALQFALMFVNRKSVSEVAK